MTPSLSMYVTVPVPAFAPSVAIVVNAPPLTLRWSMNPVSLVALSVQLRLTCGPACEMLAARLVGVAGTVGTVTVAGVAEKADANSPFTAARLVRVRVAGQRSSCRRRSRRLCPGLHGE